MWLQIPMAALLLQAAPSQQARAVDTKHEANAILEAANSAVLHFLTTWRATWLAETNRSSRERTDIRLRDVHCHWDGSFGARLHSGRAQPPTLIHNGSRRSMCPNWIPTSEADPDDEQFDPDVSLSVPRREAVRTARRQLIDSLAILDARKPGDAWITGQRVRFLVDQSEFDNALAVTRSCTAGPVWCSELAGFTLHAARRFASADSAFDAAASKMSASERCEWNDLRLLLDDEGRDQYEHWNCDERAAANERLWWLSTPMFSDSVDDRRSTHYSRKVLVRLHSALQWDERFDWRGRYGANAVSEMLERYGWPAYSDFGGEEEERAHAAWMNFYDSTRTATAEYPRDRLHLFPEFRATTDPFHSRSDWWQINMPPLKGDDEPAEQWWPVEHYARVAGPIVQLTEQTVLLRRDHDILLATAAGLSAEDKRVAVDSATIYLMRSRAAHNAEKVEHVSGHGRQAVVLTAHVPSAPAVIGTEIRAPRKGQTSARTRVGITPPPTLETLKPGELAISEPVLLSADDAPPTSADAALMQMLGTTKVRGNKLGLYWETYGKDDSVDVAVVLSRHEPISKVRRLGMLLHVAHDLNGSVAMRWREPDLGTNGWTIPATVPVRARSIRVDMSRIEPGHYTVQVVVKKRGVLVPITSEREFVFEGAK